MLRKKNRGTRMLSYGLVTTVRSNEKQLPSPGTNHVKPEKDQNPGNSGSKKGGFSKIAAKINISVTGKVKKTSETTKPIETGKEKDSRESESLGTPKSAETIKERENKENETLETPKSVETCTEQEPKAEDDGLLTGNSMSIPQDGQPPEAGCEGESVDHTISVKHDRQPQTKNEESSNDNSLSIQQDPGTKEEFSLQEPENRNESPLQNNSLQMQSGTNQKCMACDKTVYLVDKLTANNRVYHRSCFRCHHCNGTLKLGNFNSFEGVLYCRPHFDQLFKRTGSLDKSFEGKLKAAKQEKNADGEKPTANKFSTMFARTTERCVGCNNTVYPTEKVTVNGTPYHKSCFKCSKGGCTISLSNYIAFEGRLYCKHHHIQLIKEKGNLSQLEADYGKDQVKGSDTAQ